MAKERTLKAVKEEKAIQKRRAKRRKRILVLLIEIIILIILLGIGYVMTNMDAIQQMEWYQNIVGLAG